MHTLKIIDPAHLYELSDGRTLNFIKVDAAGVRTGSVTNEELIDILVNRTETLNDRFPCDENRIAISCLATALDAFNLRTKRRMAAGVEGKHEAIPEVIIT